MLVCLKQTAVWIYAKTPSFNLDMGLLQTMMHWERSEKTQSEEVYKIRPISGSHKLSATRREVGRRE
jgi:hypothetical protein